MNCRVLTTPSRTKVFFLLLMQAFLLYLFIQYSLNPELTETSVEDGSDHRPLMVDKSTIPPTAKPLAILASERRVRFIKEYCSKSKEEVIRTYPYFLDYLQTLLNWIWMVSPKHHLFYCATPKSGSTTWKSYIMEDLKINWTGLDTHDAATSYIGSLEVYNEINLTTVEFLETYRPENRFLFVRNPWARLASAYDDKIKDKKWKLKNLCIGWEIYQNVKKVTFEQFIDCILERPERLLYQPHTHPVSSLCAVCHMDYNVIFRGAG
ncbi:carbohydrate sulfotransferase 9-like isoform X2 [Watersipora subatra]|uniref:carbohydrate sulfotransferase 9-like isoform X2 n=1 Tax=Watersipora subatra TaxID=2589382 RepID=UPI00355BF537